MSKPLIILEIEGRCGETLMPSNAGSPEDFMRYGRKSERCSYLMQDGQITGLKLRSMGLQNFSELNRPELHCLQALCLCENELEALRIPAACRKLQYLDLSDNKNLKTLHFEGALPQLRQLDVSDSGLEALQLPDCPAMEQIDVSRNQLIFFQFSSSCPALSQLDLSGNTSLRELTLPAGLRQLKYLHLRECGLEQLTINGALRQLRVLDLENNQLKNWPAGFRLPDGMETLYLTGNPIADIPSTIIGSGDRHNACEDVRNYLRSTAKEDEVAYLHEARLILLGNEKVGKSSIRLKLLDEKAPLPREVEDRTPGLEISVAPYILEDLPPDLTGLNKPIDFKLNIWDFGGQSRYREVQQLFCSPKSLYIFVTACDDEPKQNHDYVSFEYWMEMIHALSYEPDLQRSSPVIHVVNKTDLGGKDIDETRHNYLKNIQRFVKISCETLKNFPQLRQEIQEVLPEVDRNVFSDRFNKNWLGVKDILLERQEDNHIDLDEYIHEICASVGMSAPEAKTWLRTLHHIGAIIYFGENEQLKNWVILNPIWVKNAIFKILDCGDHRPLSRHGIDLLWKDYQPAERDMLLLLMATYGLCYEQTDEFGVLSYVVPALLNDETPDFEAKLPEGLPSVRLRFRYEPFLPAGSVNQLMVRLKDYIFRNLMWKNNMVLHHPQSNTYAHVQEDWREHCVYIRLYGNNPDSFYQELYAALEAINTDFRDTHFLKRLELLVEGEHNARWRTIDDLQELRREDLAFLWESGDGKPEKGPKDRVFEKIHTKTPNQLADKIRKLLQASETKEALERLAKVVPEASVLLTQFNEADKRNKLNILSFDEFSKKQSEVTYAALAMLKDLDS